MPGTLTCNLFPCPINPGLRETRYLLIVRIQLWSSSSMQVDGIKSMGAGKVKMFCFWTRGLNIQICRHEELRIGEISSCRVCLGRTIGGTPTSLSVLLYSARRAGAPACLAPQALRFWTRTWPSRRCTAPKDTSPRDRSMQFQWP